MKIDLKQEYYRKSVHLSSLIYPIIYLFTNQHFMIWLLLILFLGVLIWDILRINGVDFKFLNFIKVMLREKEINKKNFVGATWFLASCLFVVIFFEKHIALMSIVVLIISDTLAAIVGKKYGRIKILDKTFEGSLAFFMSGFFVLTVYSLILGVSLSGKYYLSLMFVMLVTTVGELIANKIKVDDNLLITISCATLLYMFSF